MALMRRLVLVFIVLLPAHLAQAYSVLSHEALVDALWDVEFKRILLQRFPHATPSELKEAHSYAYGGAVIQDMGFYPHNNGYFSDLTHYVRSADFILSLIDDSRTLDEYAFALGALSHYYGDNIGHRWGTNRAEPLLYVKLRKKFGDPLTYAEDPNKHLETEYAFDVNEIAKGKYAGQSYQDFIGFNVAEPLLKQAFRETYGFDIDQMYGDFDKAIGSDRYTLRTLIPFFTRVAWAYHKDEIRHTNPTITKKRFLYTLSRSSFERHWGKKYQGPTLWDKIVAFLVKILPPIGEIRILRFRALTPQTQQIFMHSFDQATPEYQAALAAAADSRLRIENKNFDLGSVAAPGEYSLQDDAYAYWLNRLARNSFVGIDEEIRSDLLSYYSNLNAPLNTKKDKKQWQLLLAQLSALKALPAPGRPEISVDSNSRAEYCGVRLAVRARHTL